MHPIGLLLIREVEHRILGESIPRIRKCLVQLTPGQIWFRPYPEMASIGNLVLHLIGNARQWILQAMVGQHFVRDRVAEFSETGPIPTEELLQMLTLLEADLRVGLPSITEDQMLQIYPIQIFEETGVSVLVHVIEHFSYHTGQIARDTKRILKVDLEFYEANDL
ncbi:MAG: DUF1572 domain-containing protein [Saprospiraceae bacterium]|nr:DUF1572 domain-containing protein [Saprospiraceae bacterium]